MCNDKNNGMYECCTVKIQKLVTNVAILHDSDGIAFRVKSGPTLGCLVPTPRMWGGACCLHRSAVLLFSHSVVRPFCRSAVPLVVLSFGRSVVRLFIHVTPHRNLNTSRVNRCSLFAAVFLTRGHWLVNSLRAQVTAL